MLNFIKKIINQIIHSYYTELVLYEWRVN